MYSCFSVFLAWNFDFDPESLGDTGFLSGDPPDFLGSSNPELDPSLAPVAFEGVRGENSPVFLC